jgi:tetracycline 7-halogenase / FADH2 O2-dependent halogenase
LSGKYDIAVVGSGFAGSLFAMIARRLGRRVILLERGHHPRVVIGESTTPLSNLLLEELADRYDVPRVKALSKWGSWQRSHTEIGCGLKRGFSFFHHVLGEEKKGPDREDQLLVAASPHVGIADTHWYRADFDHFLVRETEGLGVDYLDEIDLKECAVDRSGVCLKGLREGREVEISAAFVVDATGPRGFLHRALKLGERELPDFPATEALYSHFSGVGRLQDLSDWRFDGEPPYPIDDAAVHHIFDSGWVWVLQFNNGVTSAGIAATNGFEEALKLSDGARAWERLLQQVPILQEQFSGAEAVQPFRHMERLGFRSGAISGDNWALLPSAAGFVDPLLSTGFPLTLLGVARLAEIIERDWGAENFKERVKGYAAQTDAELLATSRLIGALYGNMKNFPVFAALSLLYFAAASYSEAARRLGRAQLAPSFLLHDEPRFGPDCARLLERARGMPSGREAEGLIEEVYRMIEPFDVAGLGRRERRNWYPVEAEDLLRSAHKLGASRDEIMQMLDRCGFEPATSRS